jgi:hypothetical protein
MLRHAYDRITATRRSRHKRPTIHTSHTDQTAKLEFTYIFAIWEEQFHGRLASFWDAKLDDKIRRSDILVDYFGDIRLIPEISTEEMISLIELFPYDELLGPPTPQLSAGLKSIPGRLDAHLLEDVKDRARKLGLSSRTTTWPRLRSLHGLKRTELS